MIQHLSLANTQNRFATNNKLTTNLSGSSELNRSLLSNSDSSQNALLTFNGKNKKKAKKKFQPYKKLERKLLEAPKSAGNEFILNNYYTNSQSLPSTALLSNGNIAIVWTSYGQEGPDL